MVLHGLVALFALVMTLAAYLLGFRVPWNCAFNRFTGGYCLTCGATRAAMALARGQLARSFWLNPVPLLLSLFLLAVMAFEAVCAITKSDGRFRWMLPCSFAILGFAVVFCALRNLGYIPPPNAL